MALPNKIVLLLLGLLAPFVPLAWGKDDVNMAASYSSELKDGWARYIYWQQPSNHKIAVKRNENGMKTVEIDTDIPPKKNTPLAALYTRAKKESQKGDNLVLWYLDEDNQIIRHSCYYDEETYLGDFNTRTGFKSASGLAAVQLPSLEPRHYYVGEDSFLVEQTRDKESKLPAKAAKGSLVSATVPINTTDVLLFYVAEDMSLSSLKWDGSEWSKGLKPLEGFASAKMGFAAAAWSDPLIVRVFYIDKDRSGREWTFQDNSWADTTNAMLRGIKGMRAGQPVAASRGVDGSQRYLQYLYAAPKGEIKHMAMNGVGEVYYGDVVAKYDLPAGMELATKLAIIFGVPTVILALTGPLAYKNKRFCAWIRRHLLRGGPRRPSWTKLPVTE